MKSSRSALSVPITSSNLDSEFRNSVLKDASVTVCQSKLGFWCNQYAKWSVAIGNGNVPLSAVRLAPRLSPNHSRRPCGSRGPSQILLTAPTSCEVKQFGFDG